MAIQSHLWIFKGSAPCRRPLRWLAEEGKREEGGRRKGEEEEGGGKGEEEEGGRGGTEEARREERREGRGRMGKGRGRGRMGGWEDGRMGGVSLRADLRDSGGGRKEGEKGRRF